MTKLKKFKQNKLWRDKLPAIKEELGSIIHVQKLDDVQYLRQLKLKLREEVEEVIDAQNNEELIQEMGDVLEVLKAWAAFADINFEDVITTQLQKKEKFGGFEGRTFVTIAEHPEGSAGEKYCLANPY